MSKFPMPHKLKLAQLPTPIQELKTFSQKLSRFQQHKIFVKRDDLTHGPAMGNKIRKLEYHFAEALKKEKKVVFTCGAIQSNHARATAVLASELGLECVLFLRKNDLKAEALVGNYFLDQLHGAKIQFVTENQYNEVEKIFVEMGEPYRKRDGVMPYFIPEGGSNDLGAFGYVSCFDEILSQSNNNGLPAHFDSIVVANGSAGTHAGLLLGTLLHGFEDKTKILSFNVCKTAHEMAEKVKHIVLAAIQNHRLPISFMPSDVHVIDGYVGEGYAKADARLYEFIVRVNRQTGLMFDPVYTGKAFFGLTEELSRSAESASLFGKNILFIHTGGLPSLQAHEDGFRRAMHEREDGL